MILNRLRIQRYVKNEQSMTKEFVFVLMKGGWRSEEQKTHNTQKFYYG